MLPRRFRLLPLIAACVLCLGATSQSCRLGKKAQEEQDLSFSTELRLEDANGDLQESFAPTDTIQFVLNVRNRLDERVELDFPSTRTHDFIVVNRDTSEIVWQWSKQEVPIQTATTVRFDAGETVPFTFLWNQIADDGLPLEPGDYEARGIVPFDFEEFETDPLAQNQLGSILIPFTIE